MVGVYSPHPFGHAGEHGWVHSERLAQVGVGEVGAEVHPRLRHFLGQFLHTPSLLLWQVHTAPHEVVQKRRAHTVRLRVALARRRLTTACPRLRLRRRPPCVHGLLQRAVQRPVRVQPLRASPMPRVY